MSVILINDIADELKIDRSNLLRQVKSLGIQPLKRKVGRYYASAVDSKDAEIVISSIESKRCQQLPENQFFIFKRDMEKLKDLNVLSSFW